MLGFFLLYFDEHRHSHSLLRCCKHD